MIHVKSPHPPGTVAYIGANNPRYNEFFHCLEDLLVPAGTVMAHSVSYNAAQNRNDLIASMRGDWILFLDDDHAWEPDFLLRLLSRNVDAVVPLYCRRFPPFATVIYSHLDPPDVCLFDWAELSKLDGLIEIAGAGTGAMLIRKTVIDGLEGPHYFKVGPANGPTWALDRPDAMYEDVGFCWQLRKAGFKLYADLDVSIAHLTETMLIPHRGPDGRFEITSFINGQGSVIQSADIRKFD